MNIAEAVFLTTFNDSIDDSVHANKLSFGFQQGYWDHLFGWWNMIPNRHTPYLYTQLRLSVQTFEMFHYWGTAVCAVASRPARLHFIHVADTKGPESVWIICLGGCIMQF